MTADRADAVVIGAGPNGLAAAGYLARAGWSVVVLDRNDAPGGAVRSQPLTLPGFMHDTFSAFYGLLHASPVYRELELDRRVEWRHFDMPVSALTGPKDAGLLYADARRTSETLAAVDSADGAAWSDLVTWWSKQGSRLFDALLRPVGSPKPGLRFLRASGIRGAFATAKMQVQTLESLAKQRFSSEIARALFASGISHADLAVDEAGSAPMALILAMLAQDVGMPVPVGGAQTLADAMAAVVTDAGGEVRTGAEVTRVVIENGRAVGVETTDGGAVRTGRAVIADTGALALFRDLAGQDQVPDSYLAGLRAFRYGSGVFKLDLALAKRAPWAAPELADCGVVHVTGDIDTMAESAYEIRRGRLPAKPLLIVGQQSIADPSRAPAGKHTLWIECHVPSVPRESGGWDDATRDAFLETVLDRLEEHAPGLRDLIEGQAVHTPADLEQADPNLVGGDVGGGSNAMDQQLIFRPVTGWFRYRTPVKSLYLCSASTHPGGGVHGMGGRNCAQRVARDARLRLHRGAH